MARREERDRKRAGSGRRDSQHKSGGDWTTITIPDGVTMFQPKEGTYRLDIIPYKVGKGNPYADEGLWYYERTFFNHRGIGPNNDSYVCAAKTANGRCPVCDYRAKLARDPDSDEKLIDSLKPKERQLWLVYDHKDADKGVQLWEVSHHLFGKLLDKLRKGAEDDEDHVRNFDDPEAGATLKVTFSEESSGKYSFIEAVGIEFKPRPNGLDSELLDHGICLDEVVKILPYDKVKAILLQTDDESDSDDDDDDEPAPKKPKAKPKKDDWDDDDEDEPAPKKKPKKVVSKDEDEDEDEDEPAPKKKPKRTSPPDDTTTADEKGLEEGMMVKTEGWGICEITRISQDGTSLTLKDEDDELHKAVGVDDVELIKTKKKPATKDDDDDEDDDEPAPKKSKKSVEDDDDEEEDDAPRPTKKSSKTSGKTAKTTSRSEDDDDDDDWDNDPPKKSTKKKSAPKDDDDWDDDDE